jgi:hypothetical protein
MRRPPKIKSNEGVLPPEALNEIRKLRVLELMPLANALSERALKAVPGVGHIPILYTNEGHNGHPTYMTLKNMPYAFSRPLTCPFLFTIALPAMLKFQFALSAI